MKPLDLAACQVYVTPEDYASEAHFDRLLDRIGERLREARRGADPSRPCLAVFPEMIGTFLPIAGRYERVRGARTIDEALTKVALGSLDRIAGAMVRGKTLNRNVAFLLSAAPEVRWMYRRAFSRFSRRYGVWTVAGSAVLPRNAFGDLADPFAPAEGRVYNTSYIFDPKGKHVGVARKVNLVPTVEDKLGLWPGRKADLWPVDTPFGRIGTMICYDGFAVAHTPREPGFCALLSHYDDHGCSIVAQPAANFWPWEEAWTFEGNSGAAKRKEQWLAEGLFSQMAARPAGSVKHAVTAQLLGQIFDNHFDGRSHILERTSEGVRVLAEAARAEAWAGAEEVVLCTLGSQ